MSIHSAFKAVSILAASASLPAVAVPLAGSGASNPAGYSIPLQASWQIAGAPIAAPDGTSYLPVFTLNSDGSYLNGAVEKVATDGSSSALYTFSPLNNVDPVTGIGFNSDGEYPTQILAGSDGNFYVSTQGGGTAGAGTVLRLSPNGSSVTLYSFASDQNSGYEIGRSLVQSSDGAIYGLSYPTAAGVWSVPTLFRLTLDGTYTSLCPLPLTNNQYVGKLVAGSDGNFYGLMGSHNDRNFESVFKLTASCGFTVLYSAGIDLTSIVAGTDGSLYVTDSAWPATSGTPTAGAIGKILKLSTAGAVTVFHQFQPETYSYYEPGSWFCLRGCVWTPGHWVVTDVLINADGDAPVSLIQAQDGNFYGITRMQGLNGYGTVFRLTPDGSFTTLTSFPAGLFLGIPPQSYPLIEDARGNLRTFVVSYSPINTFGAGLYELVPNSPLSTSVSFSRPSVNLWQPTVLTWSSTGAQSCTLFSSIPGVMGAVATSGSKTVRVYSTELHSPAAFVVGIQCTAADGSLSNAAATLTIN